MSLIDTLPKDIVREFFLYFDYEDIINVASILNTQWVISDHYFWVKKASLLPIKEDFGSPPCPKTRYLQLYSKSDCTYGSEKFIEPSKCLVRSIKKGDKGLIRYFLTLEIDYNWKLLKLHL